MANVQNVAKTAQTTVGITVFFDEQMPEEHILAAGDTIRSWGEVREVNYAVSYTHLDVYKRQTEGRGDQRP